MSASINLFLKDNRTFTIYRNGCLIRVKIRIGYCGKRSVLKKFESKFKVFRRIIHCLANWKCSANDNFVDDVNLLTYIIENSNWFLFEKAEEYGIFEFKSR